MTGFHDEGRNLSPLLHDAVSDVEPADRLAEIRAAVAPRRRRARWYAAGGVVLAAAAVVTAVALVAAQTTPRADDPGPGPADRPETHAVAVYYVGETPVGQRLYREFRQISGASDLDEALAALTESPVDPDYFTFWQPGELLGAAVRDDVIRVEVDPALTGPQDGVPHTELMLEQVIYTVQAAAGARLPVQFVHDGNPVAEVLGLPTSEPLANGAPLDVLSLMSISNPAEGRVVRGAFTADGVASSFEGNVVWELRAPGTGKVALMGYATAGMADHLVPWETEPIDVSGLAPGTYEFVAATSDPSDGEGVGVFTDTRTVIVE